ncbi:MAG: hypothetical protein V4625_02900 [Pseudomonadota bacterium]
MVTVSTQRQLREVRDLDFCHACAKPISSIDATNFDHVPAQACFDVADRNPPLKLRTHFQCNNDHTANDEKLGQLIAAHRHMAIDPEQSRLNVKLLGTSGSGPQFAYFDNLDVVGAVRRWVGGFHAALYREPLPPDSWFQVTTPLPRGTIRDGSVHVEPILPQHLVFVEALKSNRAMGRIDRVVTCAAKMRYECVWVEADGDAGLFCIFGLDIYEWTGLGDGKNFGTRGCTGAYRLNSRSVPPNASIATRFIVPFKNQAPFDPFES